MRADRLAGVQEGRQDGVEFHSVTGPGQVPWARAVDVAVRLIRDPPDRLGGPAEVVVVQCPGDQARCVRDGVAEGGRVRCARHRGGNVPVAVAMDQREDPVDEVAQPVGELIVGPADEAVHGEVGICAPGHLAQQPPAHRVGAVLGDELIRVNGGAVGLTDLASVLGEVAVDDDVGGDGLAGG